MRQSSSSGQAALLLIMVMAVIGALSVSVASRGVENLRTQEIETSSSRAFRAAEAGLEQALAGKTGGGGSLSFSGGSANFDAYYGTSGSGGFIVEDVEEGDVVQVSLEGASGVSSLNLYWDNPAAVKVSVLRGDAAAGNYSVQYYAFDDPGNGRLGTNRFESVIGGGNFQSRWFNVKRSFVGVSGTPPAKMVRILVLYGNSTVGVEPASGSLADQTVWARGTGKTEDNKVVSQVSLTTSPKRVPAIFDNVLYTNESLSQ